MLPVVFARTAMRIYSIDTFVSSDTPARVAPLRAARQGAGVPRDREPACRRIPNARASRASRRASGLPLQIGRAQGGTDGTRFTFGGAPNQGLSWPGRYSHSPGEVLDLRDLDVLTQLIVAVAMAEDQ